MNQDNYISYFQTTTTVGIVSKAASPAEAAAISKEKIEGGNLACGVLMQTPYELAETEVWKPGFTGFFSSLSDDMTLPMNEDIKRRIATKLGKSVEELTDTELTGFLNNAIEQKLV